MVLYIVCRSLEESNYLEIRRDGTTAEWAVKGMPMQISHVRLRESDSADSFSPPPLIGSEGEHPRDQIKNKVYDNFSTSNNSVLYYQPIRMKSVLKCHCKTLKRNTRNLSKLKFHYKEYY
jgi:hypothetical protein